MYGLRLWSPWLALGFGVWSCTSDSTTLISSQTAGGPATGHWTADGPDFIAAMDISDTITLATGIGTVKGTVTLTGPGIPGGAAARAASGTDSSGSIRLQLTATAVGTAYLTGHMVADTAIDGVLDSSGFQHIALAFSHYPVVVSLTVRPHGDSVLPRHTVQFADSAFDLLGQPLTPPPVTWGTTDSGRATISGSGLLTAVSAGAVNVRAGYHGAVGQAAVNVLRPVVSALVYPASLTLVVPATVPLTATLLDTTGSVIAGRSITWSSLNGSKVRVNANGSVTGAAPGVADIRVTVTLDGKSGDAQITVRTVQPTQLAAGEWHSCAIDADSTVACWGTAFFGQLGFGLRALAAAPVFVNGNHRFTALVAGIGHTCGIAADSAAYCWGDNAAGQLGDGDDVPDSVPGAVVGGLKFIALTAGANHTCGLVVGGAAYCWGSNQSGELGIGSTSPGTSSTPVPVTGGLSFTSLAAGWTYTCGLAADSTAYCWGGNGAGSLGDSSTTDHSAPAPVMGGLKFAAIATGATHTCALTATGAAHCWGNNRESELGDSSGSTQQLIPVAVHSAGVLFTAITGGDNHTCARATSGQIYCWGGNDNGQVGPIAGATADVPVQVGLTGTAVVAGGHHTCATTASGAYCWGDNEQGQLGSGDLSLQQSAVPVKVSGQP